MLERDKLNEKHYNNPQEGDYWHEMFCPYFIVLSIVENGYIICSERIDVDSGHWRFDLSKATLVDKNYFDKVKYQSISGFCADVVNNITTNKIVKEWEDLGSPIIISEEKDMSGIKAFRELQEVEKENEELMERVSALELAMFDMIELSGQFATTMTDFSDSMNNFFKEMEKLGKILED